VTAADQAIPRIRFCSRSKRWMNQEIKRLPVLMARAERDWRKNLTERETFTAARTTYWKVLRKMKESYWNEYLESAQGPEVWRAYNYTKSRKAEKLSFLRTVEGQSATTFTKKSEVLLKGLFPDTPNTEAPKWEGYHEKKWNWPRVVKTEVKDAIFLSFIRKASGPDRISFRILREAYEAIPEFFNLLFPALIGAGYHPKCFKKAIGVILKTPQNARPPYRDYELPKAYRVISLFNCFGKAAEKIVVTRLSNLAEVKKVLHRMQIGGRRQKSAVNAAMLLTDYIQEKWTRFGEKGFAVLMDIANAFAAVAPN
jgi:hypothetical protein